MSSLDSKVSLASNYQAVPKVTQNDNEKVIREKTDQFEAIIIKMMLDNAMKDSKDLYTSSNDPGDKIYKSMYRDELAKSSAGGFGFSQMLFEHLTQNNAKIAK